MASFLWFAGGMVFGAFSGVFAVALLSTNRTYEYMQGKTGGDADAGDDQRGNG